MSLAEQLFVGPAVVVDDEVNYAETEAAALVAQLEQSHIPVLRRTQIPDDGELVHWQKLSLIILDWDLVGALGAGDDVFAEDDVDTPLLGTGVPENARRGKDVNTLRFVRKLLTELYCPIFVVSNQDPGLIWRELHEGLDESERGQLDARVLVKSKSDTSSTLFEALDQWLTKHPAIYALKTWEAGYEQAKSSVFSDFQASSTSWPSIIWETAKGDSVNPNFELTETISRNLAHRMDPNIFEEQLVVTNAGTPELESLRRVLHQKAVIPAHRLFDDVLSPGDFFFEDAGHSQPDSILICLTPACDLVPRDGGLPSSVRMIVVEASRIPDEELSTAKAVKGTLGKADSLTSIVLSHLTPADVPYVVRFKNWDVTTWGALQRLRQGRLLDPYLTLVQQRFYQYMQRQGIPSTPDPFHEHRP